MTPAELHAAIEKGEAIAVDVRGTVPYEIEHIAGAVWAPLGLMKQRAGELPEEKILVTYCTCKAEETSLEGALLLARMGFKKVAVLQGGFPAWKSSGYATASKRKAAPPPPPPPQEEPSYPAAGGRLAPPAAVKCDPNRLTVYVGTVRDYRRGKDRTTMTIDTTAGTVEPIALDHPGSDDPSKSFLILSEPFTPADWKRIERKKGELHPRINAAAWVCEDGTIVVDWHPGSRFTGGE